MARLIESSLFSRRARRFTDRGIPTLVLCLLVFAAFDEAPAADPDPMQDLPRMGGEYHVVGVRVGHEAEQGALRATSIEGRARFGRNGAKYSLQGHEVTLQNFLESPAITSNKVAVTERDVEALAARPDGELAVIVTRNPEASGEAGALFLGRIGSPAPRGVYHFRACRYEFTDEPALISEDSSGTLEFARNGSYKIRSSTMRSVWRDFAVGLWTVEEDSLSEDGEFEYAEDGTLRAGNYNGFVAAGGRVVILTIDNETARGMIVAFAEASGAGFTQLDMDTTFIGFWLELEGRHIGVVTLLGSWKLRPNTSQIDAPIRKEKWERFPHDAKTKTEIFRITPSPQHVMSPNGAFGPRGDGTDVDILMPDQTLALLFARFDIMTDTRAESVRGFVFGVPR